MAGKRQRDRTRATEGDSGSDGGAPSGADEPDANSKRASSSGGPDAGIRTRRPRTRRTCTLSVLEKLHPDVLDVILQKLGPVEASRLRSVSGAIRDAVDRVVWPAFRLRASSAAQMERAAACLDHGAIRMAAGSTVEVAHVVEIASTEALRSRRVQGTEALLAACSAASGGVASVSIIIERESCDAAEARGLTWREIRHDSPHSFSSEEIELLLRAALDPLSAPEADGGSRQTLTSVSVTAGQRRSSKLEGLPHDLPRLLARFPRLERLRLPYGLGREAAGLPAALPALRSLSVPSLAGEVLAALAAHPALEELELDTRDSGFWNGYRLCQSSSSHFAGFALGPAAGRLRRLRIAFGPSADFHLGELPYLGHFATLERLELALQLGGGEAALEEALPRLARLRELDLQLIEPAPHHLWALARALAALRQRSLVALTLAIYGTLLEPEAAGAFAALLRAAGPALVDLSAPDSIGRDRPAFAAFAACTGLRRLELHTPCYDRPRVSPTMAADAFARCGRLARLALALHFNTGENIHQLRRLAAGCALGEGGSGLVLQLCPGGKARGEGGARLRGHRCAERRASRRE